MTIIPYDDKCNQEIYDFVMNIKVNELGWNQDATDLHRIPEVYLSGEGNFWLALENDKIVGTIALEDMGENQGYLKRMYISKELRGTGLAQELLETLLEHAKENGFKEIFLATDDKAERAIAFYEKSGFKRIDSLPNNFTHVGDTHFFRLDLDKRIIF